jgi:hypothetical protein
MDSDETSMFKGVLLEASDDLGSWDADSQRSKE